MFPRIEYLHWIEGRTERLAHDLGSSDLRGSDPHPGGIVPDRLKGLPDPPGDVTLEELVAEVYGVDEGNVLATAGASLANLIAFGAAFPGGTLEGNGDAADGTVPQVLVEKPGYEPLLATPRAVGARVDRFLRTREDYALDPARVQAAFGTRPVLVTVTNRHNPSGRLSERDRLADVAAEAREAGARLMVDEVYAPYTADDGEGPFGGPSAAGIDGAVVTSSLTKFHGLGGLRVGWIVADREFIETAREVAAHVPALSQPGRALGRRALFNRDQLERRSRRLVRENHERLAAFVDSRDDLMGTVPRGSPYAFLAHESADGDEVVAAAEERDLLVVPGRFFDDADRFRVSLGRDPDHVEAALAVLGETLDGL